MLKYIFKVKSIPLDELFFNFFSKSFNKLLELVKDAGCSFVKKMINCSIKIAKTYANNHSRRNFCRQGA